MPGFWIGFRWRGISPSLGWFLFCFQGVIHSRSRSYYLLFFNYVFFNYVSSDVFMRRALGL